MVLLISYFVAVCSALSHIRILETGFSCAVSIYEGPFWTSVTFLWDKETFFGGCTRYGVLGLPFLRLNCLVHLGMLSRQRRRKFPRHTIWTPSRLLSCLKDNKFMKEIIGILPEEFNVVYFFSPDITLFLQSLTFLRVIRSDQASHGF